MPAKQPFSYFFLTIMKFEKAMSKCCVDCLEEHPGVRGLDFSVFIVS